MTMKYKVQQRWDTSVTLLILCIVLYILVLLILFLCHRCKKAGDTDSRSTIKKADRGLETCTVNNQQDLSFPLNKLITRKSIPSSLKRTLQYYQQMKTHCFFLREYGTEKQSELDSFVEQCYYTFLKKKMYDMAVLAQLQKSGNLFYRKDIKGSLKCARKARRMTKQMDVTNKDYLMICTANTLTSRYKKRKQLGKAEHYLQEALHYSQFLQVGECTAHVFWAQAGYYKMLMKFSKFDQPRRHILLHNAIKCYMDSVDHELSIQDNDVVYHKVEAMYSLMELIRVVLDFPEDPATQNREIVTKDDIQFAQCHIINLSEFHKTFIQRFLKNNSSAQGFYNCRLNIIWAGFYIRKAQLLMKATGFSGALIALQQCCKHSRAAEEIAKVRTFSVEIEHVERLLSLYGKALSSVQWQLASQHISPARDTVEHSSDVI